MFKEGVATIFCMVEMDMSLSFFDMMMHLVVHLVKELVFCSLIHTQWTYCIKCTNKVFKGLCGA